MSTVHRHFNPTVEGFPGVPHVQEHPALCSRHSLVPGQYKVLCIWPQARPASAKPRRQGEI